MIRSIPPASAHLALRPVPGPAADDRPALGDLAAEPVENLVARSVGTWVVITGLEGGPAGPAGGPRRGVGERRVVDVLVADDRRGRAGGRPGRRSGRRTGRASASGSWNGLPGASSAETPPQRDHDDGRRRRAGRGPRPSARPSAAFSSGVVRIRVTDGLCAWNSRPANRSGTVALGPKLTMSSAPTLTTCGIPRRHGRLQPVGPGREDAADQLVGQLGRRQVEHARRPGRRGSGPPSPGRRRPWRGRRPPRSPRPRARAAPGRRRGSSRRTSSPRRPAGRRRRRLGGRGGRTIPAIAMRGVGQGGPRQPVQAGEVGDRVDHHDVAAADERPGLAAGQGADHHLRQAERQGPHRRRADHRPRRAAEPEDSLDPALAAQVGRRSRRPPAPPSATASPRSPRSRTASAEVPARRKTSSRSMSGANAGGPSEPASMTSVSSPCAAEQVADEGRARPPSCRASRRGRRASVATRLRRSRRSTAAGATGRRLTPGRPRRSS